MTRLEGVLYGAGVAIALAWFVPPIKTSDMLRRRIADTLAAFSDYLTAAHRRHTRQLPDRQDAVDHALDQLHQAATPTLIHRRLTRKADAGGNHRQAKALLGLLACRAHCTDSLNASPTTPTCCSRRRPPRRTAGHGLLTVALDDDALVRDLAAPAQ